MRRVAPPAAGSSEPQQQGLHPEHPDYDKRMEDAQQRAEVAAAHFRDNPEGGREGAAQWWEAYCLVRLETHASLLPPRGWDGCKSQEHYHACIPSHKLIMRDGTSARGT